MWLWSTFAYVSNISMGQSYFVDHTIIDQTSILRFIEDNWSLGRIGNHSYDEKADSILKMFDFDKEKQQQRASPLFFRS